MVSGLISKSLFIFSFIVFILFYLQLIQGAEISFDKQQIIYGHQYWRLLTSLYNFGHPSLHNMLYLFVHFFASYRIETQFFVEQPADFLLFLFFGWISCWVIGFFNSRYFFGSFMKLYCSHYLTKMDSTLSFGYLEILLLLFKKFENKDYIALIVSQLYFYFHDVLGVFFNNSSILRFSDKINHAIAFLV